MTSDERTPDADADELSVLERELRSLPRPAPPAKLLDALLRDIPQSLPHGIQRGTTWPWRWAAAAAAAALLIALVSLRQPTSSETPTDVSVSVDFVLTPAIESQFQETDPCSILPPSPEFAPLLRRS